MAMQRTRRTENPIQEIATCTCADQHRRRGRPPRTHAKQRDHAHHCGDDLENRENDGGIHAKGKSGTRIANQKQAEPLADDGVRRARIQIFNNQPLGELIHAHDHHQQD